MAKTSGNLLARYPVVFFFLLAYLFSWPSAFVPFDNVILEILSVAAPTLAAVIVVSAISGREGTDNLFSRLFHWRVGYIWYLVAILAPFLFAIISLGVLMLVEGPSSQAVFRMPWSILPALLIGRLLVNVWEEIGWRGFALPMLQSRYSALVASLVIGILWAIWHVPEFLFGDSIPAEIPLLPYILEFIFISVVYTWIYNHTGGSLLLVTLFHVFENVSTVLVVESGADISSYYFVHALVVLLASLTLVVIFGPETLTRKSQPAPTLKISTG